MKPVFSASLYSLFPGFIKLVQQLSEAATFKALMMCCRSTNSHNIVCPVLLEECNKEEEDTK